MTSKFILRVGFAIRSRFLISIVKCANYLAVIIS